MNAESEGARDHAEHRGLGRPLYPAGRGRGAARRPRPFYRRSRRARPARSKPPFCARRMRTPKSSAIDGTAALARRRRICRAHRRRHQGALGRAWRSASRPRSSAGRSPSIACATSASRSQSWSRPTATSPRMRSISSKSAIAHCRRSSIRSPRSTPDAPVLHPGAKGNLVSERCFRYGDPERAFAAAGAPHPRRGPLSAQFVHADRDLRRRRRIRCRAKTPTTSSPISRARSACIR